jgi:hypothetical protein
MDTTPANALVVGDGKCWEHKGTYMGKYTSFRLVGRPYDPDPEYTFENGIVSGLGLKFTEVPCVDSKKGGKRKTRKGGGRKRNNRSKRN